MHFFFLSKLLNRRKETKKQVMGSRIQWIKPGEFWATGLENGQSGREQEDGGLQREKEVELIELSWTLFTESLEV